MLTSEAAQSPKRHNMLPQVLLVLHGTSTARTSVGRRVELYHVTMKYNRGTKEAKIRYNTLRKPYENAFAALFKARKSNNDQPLARNTNDVSVARTTTSPELSEYLKRLADDMLMELHAATPYRSDTIRLPRPPPSSSHARQSDVDSRLEYTEEDAAYLERIAMGMWANALDANEIVLDHDHEQHDDMKDDENTFQLDRDWERALEAEEAATNRGKTESAEDEVIHNLAQAYFPSYYDNSDDDDDDAFDVTKGKLVTEEMAKPKARSSMSHVLQGYIDDMYYGDDAQVSQATPTSPRPSISLTA
ncbi:hypothetical protein DYB25_000786 [Aphanomyces astaci]|uniref:Uncharacterized protein n=1 Tax=Aphanomyces astaci TaxID=112090 RepID=A0A397B6Y0_APHAT|nr:hypothetical protein DYB25_000786 [Aphanomyces astaci]RHY69740.1 hypothetical protein DYB30_000212 [Aphanomyces astaci]